MWRYHHQIFDADKPSVYGVVEGINDFINFESSEISGIEQEFHNAVDDYLAFCSELGKKPEKEYKGQFNVRISPELHKKLTIVSLKNDDSLNASVEKAIRAYIETNPI